MDWLTFGVPVNTSTASTYILSINENFPVAGQKNDSQGFKENFRKIKSALETITDTIHEVSSQTVVQFQDNDIGGYSFKNLLLKNSNVTAAAPGDGTLPIDYSQASYWPITFLNGGVNTLTIANMPFNSGTGVLVVSINTSTPGTSVLFTTTDPGVSVVSLGPEDQPFEIGSSTPYFFKFWNDYTDPYIYVKKVSQDIIYPVLSDSISSDTFIGKTGLFDTFSIGNLTFTDGNPVAQPTYGTLLSYYCDSTTLWGVYANGTGGTYHQIIEVNSLECGYVPPPPPPPHGTLLTVFCVGTTKWGNYADGSGGTYAELIEQDSLYCGYVPPPLYNEIITVASTVAIGQIFSMSITGGQPNTGITWRITSGPNGLGPSNTGTNFDSSGTAIVSLGSLSDQGLYSFRVEFAGTQDVRTFNVSVSALWINWPSLTPAVYTTPYYLYNTTTNYSGYKGVWTPGQSLTSNEDKSQIVNTNGAALNSGNFNVYRIALKTPATPPTVTVNWPYGDGSVFLDTTAGSGLTTTNISGGTQYIPILGGTAPSAVGTYTFTINATAGSQSSTITCALVVVEFSYNEVVTGPGLKLVNQSFDITITGGQPNTDVTYRLSSGTGSPGQYTTITLDVNGSALVSGLTLPSVGTRGYTFNFAATGHVRSYTINIITSNLWVNWPVVGALTYATYNTLYYMYNGISNIDGFYGVWAPGESLTTNEANSEIVNLLGASLTNNNATRQQIGISSYNNVQPTIDINWPHAEGNIFLDTASPYGSPGTGFVVTTQGGGRQFLPLLGGTAPFSPGIYTFDMTAMAGIQSHKITCALVVVGAVPADGTLLSTHCVGYDKYGTYADGSGGTYDQLIETNSAYCGYTTANEVITGPATSRINTPFTINVSGGNPGEQFSWVVSPGGLTGSGTNDGSGNAVISNQGVAPNYLSAGTYTYTFTFSIDRNVRTYTVTIIAPTPRGTLISNYCVGYTQWGTFADGNFSTYNQVVQSNSPACGYVPPPPVYNETVTGPTNVPPLSSTNITVTGGAPFSTVTETSGGISAPNNRITLDGSGSGTFSAFIGAPIYYRFSFSFAATGHTRTLAIAGNYTYDIGLKFELNLTDAQIAFVKMIGQQIYSSNNAFTVTYTATPETRWGFYRVPDVGGLIFWMNSFALSGPLPTTLTQEVINALFYAADQQQNNPGGGDYYRARTPNKAQITVQPPWYGDFDGRPLG